MTTALNDAHDFVSSIRTKKIQKGPDKLHVDPHFIEDSSAARVVEFCIKRRKNLLVVGPTGCGKSSLVINVAARLGESLEHFSCGGETSTDELIAKPWRRADGSTVTVYGSAIRAYSEGKGLLLEEVDHANADILAPMHRILEPNQNYYVLNAGEEEVVERNPSFFTLATSNTIGTGEDTFLYAGTKPLNTAFLNRFVTVTMSYIKPEKESIILVNKTGISKAQADLLVAVAAEAREHMESDMDRIATPVSTRDLLEWSEFIVGGFTPLESAYYAFLNRANESDREILTRLVENRF